MTSRTASRRVAVGAACGAVVALAGCSSDATDEPGDTPSSGPSGATSATATEVADDPDRVAVDAAVATTTGLLDLLAAGGAAVDPDGLLAALHTAHLDVLTAGGTVSGTDGGTPRASPTPKPSTGAGGVRRRARLRSRELAAQRQFAMLAMAAESGSLARLLASMSAGVAAHVAVVLPPEARR